MVGLNELNNWEALMTELYLSKKVHANAAFNELVSQTLRKCKDKAFHGKRVLAFNAVVELIALARLLSIAVCASSRLVLSGGRARALCESPIQIQSQKDHHTLATRYCSCDAIN